VRRRPGWPDGHRAPPSPSSPPARRRRWRPRWPRAATAPTPSATWPPGAATGDAAKLQAVDGNRFTPKTLQLPAGKEATIQITNTDDRAHDFAVEAANLNTATIKAAAAATATLTVPAGTTKFKCTLHRGMTGTIQGA
jgi:plastocyanin